MQYLLIYAKIISRELTVLNNDFIILILKIHYVKAQLENLKNHNRIYNKTNITEK